MKLLRSILTGLFGLFADDGALALQVLVLVGGVAAAVRGLGLPAMEGAAFVLVGCLVILAASLRRAGGAARRSDVPAGVGQPVEQHREQDRTADERALPESVDPE